MKGKQSPVGVLLIDMQWKFLNDKQISDEELEILVLNQKKVLKYCTVRDIPVFVIEYFNEGETIAELKGELYTIPRKVRIIKKGDNAFSGTNLEWFLRRLQIEKLFIMGVASDKCVQKTVIGALNAQFKVVTGETTMHPLHPKLSRWFKKNTILSKDIFDTLCKQNL